VAAKHELAGFIAGAGFASGDRLVVGSWVESPVGPFGDVMWAATSGERTLFAPTRRSADLITAVYEFDRVEVVDLAVDASLHGVSVAAPGFSLELVGARRGPRIPIHRPAWFTRHVEGPIARAVMGVRTYGVSPTGVQEWYRADAWRRIESGRLVVGGVDQGTLADVRPPTGFGFSEPPKRPTITQVRPLLVDPTGRLDALLA
jgi:hypothetical protein